MKNGLSTLKITTAFTAILTVAVMLVACNRNNGADNAGIPPGYNPNAIGGCTTGTYYMGGYCNNANGTAYGAYNGINFITDNYQYRNITITNSSVFRNLLKDGMGVCDRAQTSAGLASCSSWTSGYFQIVLQAQSAQSTHLYATFSAYPRVDQYMNWSMQLPSVKEFFLGLVGFPVMDYGSAIRNPLTIDAVISNVNKSQGFEARGYGDLYTTANTTLFQIIVSNQKLDSYYADPTNMNLPGLQYQIAFRGEVFATGTFRRY